MTRADHPARGFVLLLLPVLGCVRQPPPPAPATGGSAPASTAAMPSAGIDALLAGPHTLQDRPDDAASELRDGSFFPAPIAAVLPRSMAQLIVAESWDVAGGWHVRQAQWADPDGRAPRTFDGFRAVDPDAACATTAERRVDVSLANDGGVQTLCVQHLTSHQTPALLTHRTRMSATRADLARQLPALLDRDAETALLTTSYVALAACVDQVRIEHALTGGAVWMRLDGRCTTDQLRALDPWCRDHGLAALDGGGCTGALPGAVEVGFERRDDGTFTLALDI